MYRITEEKKEKGICSLFSIGQIVDENDIKHMLGYFSKYKVDKYESIREKKYYFYNIGIFGQEEFKYEIKMSKI